MKSILHTRAFAEWIKAQAPRWKAEADEAIERFNLGGWAA